MRREKLLVLGVLLFGISSVLGFTLDHSHHYSPTNSSSCVGKCNQGNNPGAECQCNTACQQFGDCCEDYQEACVGTCRGKCLQPYDPANICHCNDRCNEFGNCCADFNELCGISSEVLEALAEELLSLDVNNVAHLVSVSVDVDPLFRFSDDIYLRPTIAKLIPLHDNYFPDVTLTEVVTEEKLAEETEFLDLVFATPVMRRAQEFLRENNFESSREYFYKNWFGIYNRGGGLFGSSGFEHVFLGELMNGISGFHNWIYFVRQERAGKASNGVVAQLMNFGKGLVIEHSMNWLNNTKPIGGGFIGTSPEFEMAIYSVCFFVRPNALCPISLNGNKLNIQTYVTMPSHSNVTTFISTSYTVLYPNSSLHFIP